MTADALPGTDPIVVSNTASVTSDRPDQNPNDDVSAPVLTKVAPASGTDLALSSVVNLPNPVTGGYDLGSIATVTNLGPGDATHVSLTDTLAVGESFVATGSDPSCTAIANVVTCALGALAKGGVATVLIITKTPEVRPTPRCTTRSRSRRRRTARPGTTRIDVATSGARAPGRLRGGLRPALELDDLDHGYDAAGATASRSRRRATRRSRGSRSPGAAPADR